MKVKTLVPWFGGCRMIAGEIGKALDGCTWVGVPFAGGMSEVPYLTARSLAVNDRHLHVMNLAAVAADPVLGPKLYRRLRRLPFHPWVLETAQRACATYDPPNPMGGDLEARLNFAVHYFVSCWMGRSAKAGTKDEFKGGLALRWDAGGGDSAVRYRSAVEGLRAWRNVLSRASFTTLDCFDFLDRCKDAAGHGIYADPPWLGDGDGYLHGFTPEQHRRLAEALGRFEKTRVAVRHGDHPLYRELYPEGRWAWADHTSRTSANRDKAEVLIVNRAA